MRPIQDVATDLGLPPEALSPYGRDKAKVVQPPKATRPDGKLVLVSAITPTSAGEGKTTTAIGLGDAFRQLGERVCLALREPSLGPVFGIKGAGTGGGRAQLTPAASINLHFTGDFHAIGAAHNLLAAMVDNHLHFETDLDLDPRMVLWRRVVDMNDRALRNVMSGLGGKKHGVPRESGFDITAASEIMAALCLASDFTDLRARLERLLVGFRRDGRPVTAGEVGCVGAMLALLRDAFDPNLVQTLEGTPALVHGGPFANIAHGCNSVRATKLALACADWTITEAGFGFDLGAEKFFDIKCRTAGLDTAAVVLVASVRALRLHGKGDVAAGLFNLDKHVESIRAIHEIPVVALNRFEDDSDADVAVVRAHCNKQALPFAETTHYDAGGAGALELARLVMKHSEVTPSPFRPVYPLEDGIVEKIRKVARTMYGARNVVLTKDGASDLERVERLGYAGLPVCIAKTHSSLTDDPKRLGAPHDFDVTVRGLRINAGAGFVIALTGDILRMPGLPRQPRAGAIDVKDGEIVGLR